MKTQISSLINGSVHTIRDIKNPKYLNAKKNSSYDAPVGSSLEERMDVSRKVFAENPEVLNVQVAGREFAMPVEMSVSGKSYSYACGISADDYKAITGNTPVEVAGESSFTLRINMDMTVSVFMEKRRSGRCTWKPVTECTVGEEFVTIL